MKKITLSLILFVIALWVAAQVPQAFKYQAVARDNAGALLSGQLVSFRIGILAESAEGPVIYSETHGVLANEFGLVNLEIGNGQVEFGEFASIEWENGSLFLQIEMDPEGGEEYQVLGASQLMSVPYALNASSANNAYWIRSGNTIYYTNGSVGIGTASPASSSILELNSATKGLRMPLLTTSQIEDMVDPVEGLVVYNTDVKSLVVFDGLNWYTLVLGECIPQPNVADAGPDQIQNNNQVMTLQGNTAAYGTGTWNVISGSGGEFADPNDPVTEFTGVPFTAYVLEWSISTACSTTVDQVNVSYYAINDIVFVSEDGNDANPGTQNQPVITISKAIELAQGSAKQTIFIAGGNYYETVTLPSGISLYGGFDPATWIKDPGNYTTAIYGGTKAVIIEDATNSALDQLAIHSEPATAIGESSYGVFVVQSSGISVTNTHVYAGDGGPGDPGQAGLNGAMGNSGQNGISGCADGSFPCLSSCSQPQGGNGGLSPVGNSGGKGGKGGYGEQAGFTGVTGTGAGGGLGGPGGMSNNYISCVEGGNDSDGLNGDYGLNGTHGSAGLAIGIAGLSGYMAADGGDGTNGQHGGGGGGGGGGRGGNTLTACDSYGSSGGGGGGGGQAGTKGYKGLGAGGSFGIFVFNSSITVESCQITTGDGGTGGSGGLGGYGGSGGYGGYGGAYGGANEQGDAGCGGNGGDGGKGGNGGSGGGGGGGPTIGILNYSSTITETTNTFNLGTSGQGGNSIGNPGSAGVSADVYEL